MGDPTAIAVQQLEAAGLYILTSNVVGPGIANSRRRGYNRLLGPLVVTLEEGISGVGEMLTVEEIYKHLKSLMIRQGLPQPERIVTGATDLVRLKRKQSALFSGSWRNGWA